jgi:hypothetical protein
VSGSVVLLAGLAYVIASASFPRTHWCTQSRTNLRHAAIENFCDSRVKRRTTHSCSAPSIRRPRRVTVPANLAYAQHRDGPASMRSPGKACACALHGGETATWAHSAQRGQARVLVEQRTWPRLGANGGAALERPALRRRSSGCSALLRLRPRSHRRVLLGRVGRGRARQLGQEVIDARPNHESVPRG